MSRFGLPGGWYDASNITFCVVRGGFGVGSFRVLTRRGAGGCQEGVLVDSADGCSDVVCSRGAQKGGCRFEGSAALHFPDNRELLLHSGTRPSQPGNTLTWKDARGPLRRCEGAPLLCHRTVPNPPSQQQQMEGLGGGPKSVHVAQALAGEQKRHARDCYPISR